MGHRGAAALAPENTLAALRAAAAARLQWVEIDARLTRDGHCVLSHDANLTRTAGQDWPIGGTTLAQLSSVEVGGWFDLQYAGEPLPTLGQALDLAAELGLSVNIEMKRTPGRQLAAIDAVAATVEGLDLSPDRLLLSSFDDRLLAAALARLPHLRRALIATQLPSDWRGLAKSLECYSLHCRHDRLTPGEAQAVKVDGYGLAAYTVNDPKAARRLWDMGVDCIITDDPVRVRVG